MSKPKKPKWKAPVVWYRGRDGDNYLWEIQTGDGTAEVKTDDKTWIEDFILGAATLRTDKAHRAELIEICKRVSESPFWVTRYGQDPDDETRIDATSVFADVVERLEAGALSVKIKGLRDPGKPSALPTSPTPFNRHGIAPILSGPPIFGAAKAILDPSGWKIGPDQQRRYVHLIKDKGGRQFGRVTFRIIAPTEETEADRAQHELADAILQRLGPDAARIHLLLAAYAADPARKNTHAAFVIGPETFYSVLNIANNRRLSIEEKDQRVAAAIADIQSINSHFVILDRVRKTKEGSLIDYTSLRRETPFWDIEIFHTGQFKVFGGEPEHIPGGWAVRCREGAWGDLWAFGHRRQFSYVAREMLEDAKRNVSEWGPTLNIYLAFFIGFEAGKPKRLNVQTILGLCGADVNPTERRLRHRTKSRVLTAIQEQEQRGFSVEFVDWPDSFLPGGRDHVAGAKEKRTPWETFLQLNVDFTARPELAEANKLREAYREKPAPRRRRRIATMTPSAIEEIITGMGWQRKQLAQYLQCSPSKVSRLLSGSLRPTEPDIKRLKRLRQKLT